MLTINTDKILFSLLILGCLINGSLFELIFFITLFLLLYRNRRSIVKNRYYKWFVFVIILYTVLLFFTIFYLRNSNSWRAVGITKVLCGISLCILFSDNLIRFDIERILIGYLIIFNLMLFVLGENIDGEIISGLVSLPGNNTLACLNVLILPHLLITYKRKYKLLKAIYMLSFGLIFFRETGTTLLFVIAIFMIWIIIRKLWQNIKCNMKGFDCKIYKIFPFLFGMMILLFFFNSNFQSFYLELLLKTDRDRFTILSQAINRLSTVPYSELIWGRGDNNFYMISGRYIVAHNFVLEIVTFEGIAGLIVLVYETIVFFRYMCLRIMNLKIRQTVMVSLAFGYLFYLLHPVYTTSFLVKIYFVMINLRACYVSEHENINRVRSV